MLLRVDLDGRSWLADVGFGADGPFHPVPLDGSLSRQPGGRLSHHGGGLGIGVFSCAARENGTISMPSCWCRRIRSTMRSLITILRRIRSPGFVKDLNGTDQNA